MQAKAIARYVRVTPRKADLVLQLIRGKRVDQATEILDFTPKHVAKVIGKVMKSAVANAVAMEGKINVEHMRAVGGERGRTVGRYDPFAHEAATGDREHRHLRHGRVVGGPLDQSRASGLSGRVTDDDDAHRTTQRRQRWHGDRADGDDRRVRRGDRRVRHDGTTGNARFYSKQLHELLQSTPQKAM